MPIRGTNYLNQDMRLKVNTLMIGSTDVTATAAQINSLATSTVGIVSVPDAATYTVLAADSGKIHLLPDFTASCTITLPAMASSLIYTFMGTGAAADAQNWVFVAPAASYLKGGVLSIDENAGAAGDEAAALYGNGSSHLTLTVTTPAGGTRLQFICNGTNWIMNGVVHSQTPPGIA